MQIKLFYRYLICLVSVTVQFGCSHDENVPPADIVSSEKKVVSFIFNETSPATAATIDQELKTIHFRFPPGFVPDNLNPQITVSDHATLTASYGDGNFINPGSCTVTAQDRTTAIYTTALQRPEATQKDVPTPPKRLCLYYGFPSVVNGSNGNVSSAINVFKDFDVIVFGDGIEHSSHLDHAKVQAIIAGLKATKPAIKIFGYIDLGVTTQNLSVGQLQSYIDEWKVIGADGVFGDDFDSNFNVTRERQNSFISYAHSKSLAVFANGDRIDEVLGGANCLLGANDYYLMESFFVGANIYRPFDLAKAKADKAYYYMKTKGVSIACSATIASANLTVSSGGTDKFKQSWYAAAMYNFDFFQFTDSLYSAQSNTLYRYADPVQDYGSAWKDFDWVRKVSGTRFERATNTMTLYINGNGVDFGTGGH